MSEHAATVASILATKTSKLTGKSHRYNSNRSNGYRTVADKLKKNGDALPGWLSPYAQNVCWERRLLNLLAAGYEAELRYFVDNQMSGTKVREVFRYFNTCWGKKRIMETVSSIRQTLREAPIVQEVCERIGATVDQLRAVRGIVRRWGSGATRYAVRAQEEGRDRFKYFCWLTSSKGQEVMRRSQEEGFPVQY